MGRQSKFTKEEKEAAVKLLENGRTVLSVANEYGVHENTVWKWKTRYNTNPARGFAQAEDEEDLEKEKLRMRRRIQELENEVDFLKKVSAYFAKSPK